MSTRRLTDALRRKFKTAEAALGIIEAAAEGDSLAHRALARLLDPVAAH